MARRRPFPGRRSASRRFMEESGQHHLAYVLPVAPEEPGSDHQEERGGDQSWAVSLGDAVERREPALRILGRVGVRDVLLPLLIHLVLVALVEELPRERAILRLVGKDPLRPFDSLGAIDPSRIP